MWYVYFLKLSNDDIYVGSTDDLKRRFSQHFAADINSDHAINTNCYVIERPGYLYCDVMFSKRGNNGNPPKEKDTQTLAAYKNQNFPRKVSRNEGRLK